MSIFSFNKKSVAITNSVQLAEFLGNGYHSSSGAKVTQETALSYAAVFTCINVLSEGVGQLPFSLFERNGNKRKKAHLHPYYNLLCNEPNSLQTSQEFREMIVAHIALKGNFYALISRNKVGQVTELFPYQPDAVTPVLKDNKITYKVRYSDGSEDILSKKEILHIKGVSFNGYTGLSRLTYARESIGLGISTEKHGAKLFSNGARPGGVLSSPATLSDPAYERIKNSWNTAHQGTDNAHKIAILEEGLQWTQVGMSAEDAQYLQTRQHQRSEIYGLFRVPAHMAGDLTRSTNNNIEHQGQEFVNYALIPYLTRIENAIYKSILDSVEKKKYYAKHNVTSLLRGDMAARANFYSKMLQNGALSPNEIRELEDMNPRNGGDIYLTPLNMAINGQTQNENKNIRL